MSDRIGSLWRAGPWRLLCALGLLLLCGAGLGLGSAARAQGQALRLPQGPVWSGQSPVALQLVDEGGAQTLARVMARFAAGEGQGVEPREVVRLGLGRAHWLAIELPAVDSARDVVLTLSPAFLQRTVFYWPLADGRWAGAEAGAARPVAGWPLPEVQPAFSWRLGPGLSRAYLRVEHPGPVALGWQLWERPDFERHGRLQHLAWGGALGGLGLLMVLALGQAGLWRDSLPLYFAATGLAITGGALAWSGLGALYLWPGHAGWHELWGPAAEGAAFGLMVLFSARLARSVLPPRGHALLFGLGLSGLALGLAWLLGLRPPWPAAAVPLYATLACLACLALALRLWRHDRLAAAGLMGAVLLWGPWLLTRWPGALPQGGLWMGRLPPATQLLPLLVLPVLAVPMMWRGRLRRDQWVRRSALKRVDPLTGLSSEHVLRERLDHLILRQHRQHRLGAVMRIRIGNLAAIQREAGQQAQESAVLQASQCIGQVVRRSGDTLARLGDGDFALLMEGDFKTQSVLDLAQLIIARGLAQSARLAGGANLRLQVACTAGFYPGCDAQALMGRLGGALDQMGSGPGGRALQLLSPGRDGGTAGAQGLELPPLRWSDQLGAAAPSALQRTRMPGVAPGQGEST